MGWTVEDYAWPDTLLRKSYVKADSAGEIAEALNSLDDAHQAWKKTTFPQIAPKRADEDAAERWAGDVRDFFAGGELKKLVGSLKILEVRVVKLQKTAKKKESTTALKDIKEAVVDLLDSADISKIEPQIAKALVVMKAAAGQAALDRLPMVLKSFKSCAQKQHPEIGVATQALAQWSDDPQQQGKVRDEIHGRLYDACRDMTQNLANLLKAQKAGADLTRFGLEPRHVNVLPTVAKSLIPIANAKSSVTDGKDLDQLKLLVRTVKVQADLFDNIASHIA